MRSYNKKIENDNKIKAILDVLNEDYERTNVKYNIASRYPLVSVVLKTPSPLGIKEDNNGGWTVYFTDNTLFDDAWKYENLHEALTRLKILITDLPFITDKYIPSRIQQAFRTMSNLKVMEGSRIYGLTQYIFSVDLELYADRNALFIETDKGCWIIEQEGTVLAETTAESMHHRESFMDKSHCKIQPLPQLIPSDGVCLIESVSFLTDRKNWYVGFLMILSTGHSLGLYCKCRWFRDCPTELVIDKDESYFLSIGLNVSPITDKFELKT